MLSKDALEIVLDPGPGFLVGKVTGGWRPVIDLSPERVCSLHPIQDGDSRLCAPVCQRGGFPSFHLSEGNVFPNTRSSVIEEAIAVPVGGDSLPVQSPVFRTVDCPTSLHLGVRRCVCLGPLPRDSSAAVPGRLAGPCLFGGGGQTERPGPSLALSLPRDSDKRGQVRSCSLADGELPWYDHRYRGRQDLCLLRESRNLSVAETFCTLTAPPTQLWQVILGHLASLQSSVPKMVKVSCRCKSHHVYLCNFLSC